MTSAKSHSDQTVNSPPDTTMQNQHTISNVNEKQDEWQDSPLKTTLQAEKADPFKSKPSLAKTCVFPPRAFLEVMENLISNPNITSSHLFRADVFYDSDKDSSFWPDARSWLGPGDDKHSSETSSGISTFIKHMRQDLKPRKVAVQGYELRKVVVRRLVPRNPDLDRDLVQTCCFFRVRGELSSEDELHGTFESAQHGIATGESNIIVYFPHAEKAEDIPWYHPPVKAIAFHHEWDEQDHRSDNGEKQGRVSIHILPFHESTQSDDTVLHSKRLQRTLENLLSKIVKHGNGVLAGYQKHSHHDQIVAQARLQDTYTRLKQKYARKLLHEYWSETTDATKGVFEDLGIAAFLLELWSQMYSCCPSSVDQKRVAAGQNEKNKQGEGKKAIFNGKFSDRDSRECNTHESEFAKPPFPGFVDIGCGNGVLTYVLLAEGYSGMGFDARDRKTWREFPQVTQGFLNRMVLLPAVLNNLGSEENDLTLNSHFGSRDNRQSAPRTGTDAGTTSQDNQQPVSVHDGLFQPGAFIISNHADELTPWTPLLAYLSDCPFISIPCCSHDLSGSKHRYQASFLKRQADLLNDSDAGHASKGPDTANQNGTVETKSPPLEDESADKGSKNKPNNPSSYSTLTAYIVYLTDSLGYQAEKETLRIPSTRNACVVGRYRHRKDGVSQLSQQDRIAHVQNLIEQESGKSLAEVRETWRSRAVDVMNCKESKQSH